MDDPTANQEATNLSLKIKRSIKGLFSASSSRTASRSRAPSPAPAPNGQAQQPSESPDAAYAPAGPPNEGQAQLADSTPATGGGNDTQREDNSQIAPEGIGGAATPLATRPPTPPFQGQVEIRDSSLTRGRGVFARKNLTHGEVIFRENPLLSCKLHGNWLGHVCTAVAHWADLDADRRNDLKLRFPQLRGLPDNTLSSRQQKKLNKFVKDYGFRPDNSQGPIALVYLLPGLLNHACTTHANCDMSVHHEAPHAIKITLRKDVVARDELFITYRDKRTPRKYSCAHCQGLHNKAIRKCYRVWDKLQALPKIFKKGQPVAPPNPQSDVPLSQAPTEQGPTTNGGPANAR